MLYRAVTKQAVLLNEQLTKKNYLQINAFLASDSRVKRNLKALLIKATNSLGSKTKKEILSFIKKNFGLSHSIMVTDEVT